MKSKAKQASLVIVGFVESAQDAQWLDDAVPHIEERLGLELAVLDDIDQSGLIDHEEAIGPLGVRDKGDRSRQAGCNGL